MTFKRVLKFTLCGSLLAGATLGYAAMDEVTLGDGTTVSWDAFVDAINNPGSIKVETLPEDHEASKSLGEKKTALQTAEGDLATAKKTLEDKEGEIPGLQKAITDAKSKFATDSATVVGKAVQDSLDVRKQIVANAKDSLDYVNRIADIKSQISDKTTESSLAAGDVSSLNADITTWDRQLRNIPTTTQNVVVDWLQQNYEAANKFYDGFLGTSQTATENKDKVVYYRVNKYNLYGDDYIDIIFSFITPTDKDQWETSTAADFGTKVLQATDANKGISDIWKDADGMYVYLGPEYMNASGSTIPQEEFAIPTKGAQILKNAVSKLKDLTDNSKYNTTKTVYAAGNGKTAAENTALAEQLQDNISAAESQLATAQAAVASAKADIAALNEQLTGVHKDSDGKLPEGETVEKEGLNDLLQKTKDNSKTYYDRLPNLHRAIVDAKEGLDRSDINAAETALEDFYKSEDYLAAISSVEDAEQAVSDATDEVEKAQDAYDKALVTASENAQKSYQKVSLTADVTVKDQIPSFSGEIDCNNHIINAPGDKPLFITFSGIIDGAAVNGKLYQRNDGGKLYSVAWWDNTNNTTPGRYYNNEGSYQGYIALDKFGFDIRTNFGVDFDANKIVTKTDETIVHELTVYAGPNEENILTKYAQVKDNAFKGINLDLGNSFVELKTADASTLNIPNLIYDKNKCKHVYITDNVAFYAPKNIVAEKVEYNRQFAVGKNAICLPFAVSTKMNSAIKSVCTYDGETYDKNDSKAAGTLWFKKIAEDIPANTPVLMVANEPFKLTGDNALVGEIAIKATPVDQIVREDNRLDPEDVSKGIGTFKFITPSQAFGEKYENRVFGLFKDKSTGVFEFANVSTTTNIPPLRMVVFSNQKRDADNKAPKRIAIRDEFGNEEFDDVVTGVNGVNEIVGFNVAGGNGEIIFTADENYGQVVVYSFDGKMVSMVNVLEGTTAVNVAKGIYIVNGKKIMVK